MPLIVFCTGWAHRVKRGKVTVQHVRAMGAAVEVDVGDLPAGDSKTVKWRRSTRHPALH